jgi:hypothetical protein
MVILNVMVWVYIQISGLSLSLLKVRSEVKF